jgi:hypothetical protein
MRPPRPAFAKKTSSDPALLSVVAPSWSVPRNSPPK